MWLYGCVPGDCTAQAQQLLPPWLPLVAVWCGCCLHVWPSPGRQLLSRHPCRVICVVWCLGRAMSLGCLSCPLCFIGAWSLAPSSLSVAVCYESAQQRCYCHIVAVTVRPDAALCEQQAACGVVSSQAACECVVCSTLRCRLLHSLRCGCVWVLSGIGKQSRVCRRSAQHFSQQKSRRGPTQSHLFYLRPQGSFERGWRQHA